jgi:ribosome modulation factor
MCAEDALFRFVCHDCFGRFEAPPKKIIRDQNASGVYYSLRRIRGIGAVVEKKGESGTMIADAYYQGYWEALEGSAREANPYESDVQRRRSWDDGWEDAQSEGWISER